MTALSNTKYSQTSYSSSGMQKQHGMITLMFTLILLFAISLTGMYGTYVTITDIKITAGMLRAQEAYDASEAGLEFAVTHFYENGADQNGDNELDTIDVRQIYEDEAITGSISSVTYEDYTPAGKPAFSRLKILSIGASADGIVSRRMSQIVNFSPIVANVPDAPLTVRGDVDIGGSLQVINLNSDTTIRAQGDVSISGSATTTTSSGVSSDQGTIGDDIASSDSGLSGMSSNAFFQKYFGINQTQMQINATVISGGSSLTSSLAEAASDNAIVWISGDSTLNSNSVIGSPESPVIIISDGTFNTSGSSTVYGLVYSTGGFGDGNLTINGAALVSGDFTGNGDLTLNYNQSVVDNLQNVGLNAKLSGSWRDF